ncbi:MAG: HAMP domain-containing histidine kinase [Bacteroidia bacterium]|nr:HAMP domain-containing histidine kinase [Bacteroidota bacterium]MBP9082946.1 HAMP domain-containing histidine kinase [Bacteroidia bacterium]
MKRSYLIISVSSIALLIVLVIQVKWIVQTAKVKEELFNEKANMVVARTAEVLSADPQACRNFESGTGAEELVKTDSLFSSYMDFYDINTDYSFAVAAPGQSSIEKSNSKDETVYKKRLEEETTQSGLELSFFVEGKNKFILEEMGTLFLTSIVLILVVLVLFWRTILSLMKEKKIAGHTTEFLNNMTHEFKTPLTNIALAGKMISKDVSQENKVKQYTDIILQENEKLRLQIEQVLNMSALERGEIRLHKDKIDIHQLIKESVNGMSLQIEIRNGVLSLDLKATKTEINGDRAHLTGAISNLIDNAIKYSPEKPVINILTYNDGNAVVLQIQDNGIGIEKEYQQKIFEKFFRVPTGDIHDVKGFGLGLTYIHKIITLHGGTISVESQKNVGTTFSITIPLPDERS